MERSEPDLSKTKHHFWSGPTELSKMDPGNFENIGPLGDTCLLLPVAYDDDSVRSAVGLKVQTSGWALSHHAAFMRVSAEKKNMGESVNTESCGTAWNSRECKESRSHAERVKHGGIGGKRSVPYQILQNSTEQHRTARDSTEQHGPTRTIQ
eukprot:gene8682-biopygen7642